MMLSFGEQLGVDNRKSTLEYTIFYSGGGVLQKKLEKRYQSDIFWICYWLVTKKKGWQSQRVCLMKLNS